MASEKPQLCRLQVNSLVYRFSEAFGKITGKAKKKKVTLENIYGDKVIRRKNKNENKNKNCKVIKKCLEQQLGLGDSNNNSAKQIN